MQNVYLIRTDNEQGCEIGAHPAYEVCNQCARQYLRTKNGFLMIFADRRVAERVCSATNTGSFVSGGGWYFVEDAEIHVCGSTCNSPQIAESVEIG